MNSFDIVTEQCMAAQEGSTRDTLNVMRGDTFKTAIRLMKRGKQNRSVEDFKEAKALLKKARSEIAHTRTWPLSWFIANTIFGVLYAYGTMSDSIHTDVLYNNKANEAKMQVAAKTFLSIIGIAPGIGQAADIVDGVMSIYVFVKNKLTNLNEPGKFFNKISALMIRVVDLYIESCDLFIDDIEAGVDFN